MGFLSFFQSKKTPSTVALPFQVDMHSHLIYDVDDGVQTLEESLDVIGKLHGMGYNTLITTPHIMHDFFKNSKDTLLPKRDIIRSALEKAGIPVDFDVAAEYYLDDGFPEKLQDKENLLTIRGKYLLVETSYMNAPHNLDSVIFDIQSSGLIPILAHPERYTYMHDRFERYEELFEKGVLFQINLNSLSGYYSKNAKDVAEKLIQKKMVHFAGTDCHGEKHIDALQLSLRAKSMQALAQLPLQNDRLR